MVKISIKSIDDVDIFEGLFVIGLDESSKDLNYLRNNTKLMDALNIRQSHSGGTFRKYEEIWKKYDPLCE